MVEESTFLKEGHIVWIDDPLKKYYRIIRREPFDYETGEEDTAIFSAIAPGASSTFLGINDLEPDSTPLHLFEVLWGVRETTPVKYYMKIPTGVNRFGIDTDKEIGFIDATKSPYYDPDPLFQFYLINEWYPSVNCVNGSPVTITPKVWFKGMKYDIEEIDAQTKALVDQGRIPHRRIYFGGIRPTA